MTCYKTAEESNKSQAKNQEDLTDQPKTSSKKEEAKFKLVLLVKSLRERNLENNSKCADHSKDTMVHQC